MELPLKREEITVEINGEDMTVVLRELTYAEKSEIDEKYGTCLAINGMLYPIFKTPSKMRVEQLTKSIVEAPFGKTDKELMLLPGKLMERLIKEYDRINTADEGKKNQAPELVEGREGGVQAAPA